MLFMVPIFLQQVLGLSPLQAGLVIIPEKSSRCSISASFGISSRIVAMVMRTVSRVLSSRRLGRSHIGIDSHKN